MQQGAESVPHPVGLILQQAHSAEEIPQGLIALGTVYAYSGLHEEVNAPPYYMVHMKPPANQPNEYTHRMMGHSIPSYPP